MIVRQVRSVGAEDAVGEEMVVAVYMAIQNTKIRITKLDGGGLAPLITDPQLREAIRKKYVSV